MNNFDTFTLRNGNLEIEIMTPYSGYKGCRFDNMGFIKQVKYCGKPICADYFENGDYVGSGLCNEFGIFAPVGYECNEEFIKIGVGYLRADSEPYLFMKAYPLRKPEYKMEKTDSKVSFYQELECRGYAVRYEKTIELTDCITISYKLTNIGTLPIETEEYTHNFLSLEKKNYKMTATVPDDNEQRIKVKNGEFCIDDGTDMYICRYTPEKVGAFAWTLHGDVKITEKAGFEPEGFAVWRTDSIASPEINFKTELAAGEGCEWTRTYSFE